MRKRWGTEEAPSLLTGVLGRPGCQVGLWAGRQMPEAGLGTRGGASSLGAELTALGAGLQEKAALRTLGDVGSGRRGRDPGITEQGAILAPCSMLGALASAMGNISGSGAEAGPVGSVALVGGVPCRRPPTS